MQSATTDNITLRFLNSALESVMTQNEEDIGNLSNKCQIWDNVLCDGGGGLTLNHKFLVNFTKNYFTQLLYYDWFSWENDSDNVWTVGAPNSSWYTHTLDFFGSIKTTSQHSTTVEPWSLVCCGFYVSIKASLLR